MNRDHSSKLLSSVRKSRFLCTHFGDRQTNRQTDRQTDRQTNKRANRRTELTRAASLTQQTRPSYIVKYMFHIRSPLRSIVALTGCIRYFQASLRSAFSPKFTRVIAEQLIVDSESFTTTDATVSRNIANNINKVTNTRH